MSAGLYDDAELAALYDLDFGDYDADLALYENFAARGEPPSLELGAGSGRVALHLARQGRNVVGIDTAPAMLARAEARLDAETAPCLRLVEGDMRDFNLGETFDLVYCALGTFEHMLTADDAVASLRCAAKHLAPGGVFVCELRPLASIDWSPRPWPAQTEWTKRDPDTGDLVTKTVSGRASQAAQTTTHWLVFDRVPAGGGAVHRRAFDVTLRVFGRFEFELLLQHAGLRLRQIYGDYDLSPFSDDSDTMIIVAAQSD